MSSPRSDERPEIARLLGLAAKGTNDRPTRSWEWTRGYRSGYAQGKRERLREHGMAARTI